MAFNIKDQEGLRTSLISHLIESGVKTRHISKKTNIGESVLCHFKKGRMQLPDRQFNSLLNYLIQHK